MPRIIKFNEQQVLAIRNEYSNEGKTLEKIAIKYDAAIATIFKVINGKYITAKKLELPNISRKHKPYKSIIGSLVLSNLYDSYEAVFKGSK